MQIITGITVLFFVITGIDNYSIGERAAFVLLLLGSTTYNFIKEISTT